MLSDTVYFYYQNASNADAPETAASLDRREDAGPGLDEVDVAASAIVGGCIGDEILSWREPDGTMAGQRLLGFLRGSEAAATGASSHQDACQEHNRQTNEGDHGEMLRLQGLREERVTTFNDPGREGLKFRRPNVDGTRPFCGKADFGGGKSLKG